MPTKVTFRRLIWSTLALGTSALVLAQPESFRPPAVPLVTCDPYFSIWSRGDRLTDVPTSHWTGAKQELRSSIRVDGKSYRLMGTDSKGTPAFPQVGLQVTPTRSIYHFSGAGVGVTLTFTTPALPSDIDLLSRPVTYLTWDVRATDGKTHQIQLTYGNSGEPAVDQPNQAVAWRPFESGNLKGWSVGSVEQPVLEKVGDARRIDWGYLYAAAPKPWVRGAAPGSRSAEAVGSLQLGPTRIGPKLFSTHVILAYDDIYGIQYFTENLRPYWRRNGMNAASLLKASELQYQSLLARCAAFDRDLTGDLRKSGGDRYAQLAALAYRQTWAGSKIVADRNGQPLLLPKENTSNGCIGTVDIVFPMSPQVLLFGPSLAKALLVSNLDYASSGYWKWPFAPHDLGTYPKANGQVYGGGERTEENQMPVEESGNMLILTLALAQMEGNAKFANKYWPTLTRWANYLRKEGFDPANQLSTDDFMGHLAHQTNLSIKATLGLGAYARLAKMLGKPGAEAYEKAAHEFADRWVKAADDGDHFRLAFDQKGSWSQKYNLVWDKILGLDLYPDAVRRKEMAFYLAHRNEFGLALDSRQNSTPAKVDWSVWTATLTGSQKDFDTIVDGVWQFVNRSPQRLGMGDLYNTRTGNHIGMHSRPVVGGLFVKLLYDKSVWAKWAGQDTEHSAGWAPLPKRPVVSFVVPTGEKAVSTWSYTTQAPSGDWFAAAYDASSWASGPGGLGGGNPPGLAIGTPWTSSEIWTRRKFEFTGATEGLYLRIFHDEDADVYLNGVKIATLDGYSTEYVNIPLTQKAQGALKQGENLLAIHVRQTGGGQGIDAGLVRLSRK